MDFLFGYAGGQYDGETGLQYHQARYYDPATGRFLGEDPSSFAGGDANLYRYANGDPVNRTDPTGLAARQLGIMGSLLGAGVGSIGSYASAVSNMSLFSNSSPGSNYSSTPSGSSAISRSPAIGGSTRGGSMLDAFYGADAQPIPLRPDSSAGGAGSRVVSTRQIRSWLDAYDEDVASGAVKPGLVESASVGQYRLVLPASSPTTVVTYASGREEYIMGGGPTSGALGGQASVILAPATGAPRSLATGGSRLVSAGASYLREAGETVIDSAAQYYGSPVSPTTLTTVRGLRAPGSIAVEQGRDALGRFLPRNAGEVRPGSLAERATFDAIRQKPGWGVIDDSVSVRDAKGQLRVYDGAAISPSGRYIGLETKSGTGKLTPAQRVFDDRLNSSRANSAQGVGQSSDYIIQRAIEVRR